MWKRLRVKEEWKTVTDDYYDEERSLYYAALKTAGQYKGDITKWLEYFTDGVLHSINKVKETIVKLGFVSKIEI